jgi:PKD repeat protein
VPTSTNGPTGGDFIDGVALGTINNLLTGSATGTTYNDYTSLSTQLSQGATFTLTITGGTNANETYAAFIDFNGDSTFATTEKLGQVATNTAGQVVSINFTVPINASLLSTRLRVRSTRTGFNTNIDGCTNYTRGETEDYTVQIIAGGANGPITNFGAVQASITLGNTVDFVDSTSFSPTSWQWTFAGGTPATSSLQNPTGISYSAVGCYAVTLTATNAGGSNTLTKTCYIIVNPANPYCNTLYSTGCSGTNNINAVTFTGTTLNNSGSGCNSLSGTAYSIFPESGNTTATLYRGQAYQLNVTSSSATSSIVAWIDFNQNNVFDSLEFISVANPATQNLAASIIVNIPAGTATGSVRMRVRTRANTGGPGGSAITASQACNSFTSGEAEDYILTIADAPPVVPTANFTANTFTITAGQTVNFTDLSNGLPTSWSWTFNGATVTSSTSQNPIGVTYNTPGCYDVALTSTNAQGSNTKTEVCYITVLAPVYCATLHQNNCSANDNITAVSVSGTTLLNDSTACDALNGNGYSIWAATGNKTGIVYKTGTYNISVTTNVARVIGVWIDYDHNTVFDASEFTLVTAASTANVASSIAVSIPNTALTGTTGMRIRSRSNNFGGTIAATDACTLFTNGETEDYTITISNPPTIPPVAAFTASNDTVAIGQSLNYCWMLSGAINCK